MPQPSRQAERRRRARIAVHWRVDLLGVSEAGAIETSTKDLSSNGFYCWSPAPFAPGERMACILRVPAYIPHETGATLSLECHARVVRVDHPRGDRLYGIGCEIMRYRFLP